MKAWFSCHLLQHDEGNGISSGGTSYSTHYTLLQGNLSRQLHCLCYTQYICDSLDCCCNTKLLTYLPTMTAATHVRIMSTASSYGKPSSISANATITGALQENSNVCVCICIYVYTGWPKKRPKLCVNITAHILYEAKFSSAHL